MKEVTQRSLLRCLHLVLGIPIIGYIYSPFDQIPHYAPATRYFFLPVLVLSGLWMWKGQKAARRAAAQRSALSHRTTNA